MMKIKFSNTIMFSITAGSLLLSGCGSSATSTTDTTVASAVYLDDAVEGAAYSCGSKQGFTDAEGRFYFEKGKECALLVGDVVLRRLDTTTLPDNAKVLEENASVAQFLQSIDNDGDASNGIQITKEIHTVLKDVGVKTVPKNETELDDVVKNLKTHNSGFQGRFVSKEEAMMHVAQTKYKLLQEDRNGNGSSGGMNNMNGSNGGMNGMDGSNGGMNNGMNGNMNGSNGGMNGMMGMNGDMDAMGIQKSSTLQDFNYTAFSKPLAIPALASYTVDAEGYKVFNLDINESTTEFFSGIATKTYGINGSILGQTLRMHNGDKIKLVYHNNLNVATTMHGHGMHVPAIMDGGPVNKIQPGTTWTAHYTVNQDACTNWYHPHFMHKTAEHVYMGLAGFIIIDDDQSDAMNLPKEYGVDDIPLAIQDKRFDANGQIDYSPNQMEVRMGYKSDIMMVNGVILPYFEAPAKKVRFRVLNGSNGSVYKLKFSDGRAFEQIAVDNSFLESPVTLNEVTLTPGERAEIVVDFTGEKGKELTLVNATTKSDIMKIKVAKDPTTASQIPAHLKTLVKYDAASAVRTRKFVLNMARGDDGKMHMAINGKLMDINRIDEYVPKDDVEVWEITNMMGMTHNFHIHATHFFPLTRNGKPVPANERGYKDVIALPGHSTVKVVVKMTDYVDENTGYMYHCHFLEHEDDGMMGQFVVTNGKNEMNVRP